MDCEITFKRFRNHSQELQKAYCSSCIFVNTLLMYGQPYENSVFMQNYFLGGRKENA